MAALRAGAAIVAQSGGPTPVINASLLGVIEEAAKHSQISALYGARFGINGIIREHFVDLLAQSKSTLDGLKYTPSSALGTSRHEVQRADLQRVLEVLRAHNVRYFFYNGGNGSMGTADEIARMAADASYELNVIGIPKTIDNDLMFTDHTPGYPSTAHFFACAVRDIGADNLALPGQVEIIEVLGRNAGWIVGATALAREHEDDAPHLIYFPEQPLPLHRLLADIDRVFRKLNRCVIAVCEGQLDEHGEPYGADVRRGSRGSLAMNLGHRLAMLVSERLKIRARSEKPGLLGRSSAAFILQHDWQEAQECGRAAVRAAIEGDGGNMISLVREEGSEYRVRTGQVALSKVALREKVVPAALRSDCDVMPAFLAYAGPLIGRVRHYQAFESLSVPRRISPKLEFHQ
jgi:6-phosphofructokinase 1